MFKKTYAASLRSQHKTPALQAYGGISLHNKLNRYVQKYR